MSNSGQYRLRYQREPAQESVASALVLDQVARRDGVTVTPDDLDRELERYAERTGLTPAAVRARLEQERIGEDERAAVAQQTRDAAKEATAAAAASAITVRSSSIVKAAPERFSVR